MRKAFDALIDRKAVAESIMAGKATVAAGPFLSNFPFAPSYEKKIFSLDAARKILGSSRIRNEGRKGDEGWKVSFI
ncbi:hypothetical protein GCM10020331_085930 [Ectobacillus funiculus]